MKSYHKIIIFILLLLGTGLRLSLFWNNPPQNAFDDHFKPVSLIMAQGKIPAKDACWECNQPFLFYVGAAAIGDLSRKLGASDQQIMKICQFLPCLYGILTLPLILLILNKFPLPPLARIVPFGIVCVLPRHIYMSAMLTNDTISYLLVALCVLLLFSAIEKKFPWQWLAALSVFLTLAIFTKYTALVVLPMAGSVFLLVYVWGSPVSRKRSIGQFVLVMLVPLAILSPYMISNYSKYHNPLPTNLEINDMKLKFIPGGGINYFNFKPWEVIKTPILTPDNVKSFWTGIQGRMWFDMEPKFIFFTDPDRKWWVGYHEYLVGRPVAFPDLKHLSPETRLFGSSLITMGLIPTTLSLLGFFSCLFGMKSVWPSGKVREGVMKFVALTVLFVANAAGIIFHSLKYPYFSHMKAAFMLVSLPAFAVYLGIGVMVLEKYKILKLLVVISFIVICLLVTLHIADLVKALVSMTQSEKELMLYALRYLIKF
jgi:4-amino-4-deoxy-L-arabinose transferase-like glycosyltransferase